MKREQPYWPLILILAFLKFILPLWLQHPLYELQRDEYLYYQQGVHVDFGYLENPPLLSWLGTVSSWFGGSASWIKFWPCLFGAATVVITCLIAAELGGRVFAQFLAGLCMVTGAYMRVHFLFQPNILDIFFWTLAAYFIIRYVNDNRSGFLYGFCISLALGFWSKYSILFFAAAILLALLVSRHRKIFAEKKLYLGGSIAFLIILPNLWWQYSHSWPLIHHMEELRETQLKYLDPAGFIMEQFMMLFPAIMIWIGGLVWTIRQPRWRFIACTYLFVIALLLLGSGKGYYALGAYPMLLAAGGVAWEQWIHKRIWKRYALAGFILVFTILFIPILLPVWKPEKLAKFYQRSGIANSGLLKWEDGKDHPLPQDFADMLGWKELTEKTINAYNNISGVHNMQGTAIYCRNYGQAGAIRYYKPTGSINSRFVFSDNGSFLLWMPEELTFKHLLFIGRQMPDKDDEVFDHFQKVTVIDSVTDPYSRQFGDKIIFFEHIDSTGLRLAIEGLDKMKNRFKR